MIKKISTIAGCVISIGIIVAWFINYDAAVVKAEDMKPIQQSIKLLNQRIDRSSLEQARRDYQRRIWMLEDRYGRQVSAMPGEVRTEYRCLLRDLMTTEEKIKRMDEGE
jgi:hypothetical protein